MAFFAPASPVFGDAVVMATLVGYGVSVTLCGEWFVRCFLGFVVSKVRLASGYAIDVVLLSFRYLGEKFTLLGGDFIVGAMSSGGEVVIFRKSCPVASAQVNGVMMMCTP